MRKLQLFILLSLSYFSDAQNVENIDTISIDDYKMRTYYLPSKLNEISALEYEAKDVKRATFWGLNDSGNRPEIYRFDANDGTIINTIFITNAKNIDWEEISTDDNCIYFADFGNNYGNRKNLAIYFIEKESINFSKPYQELEAKKIEFYYPEQEKFKYKGLTTNWDAEAFFVYKNMIHIFTKEWTNLETSHYIIPIDTTTKFPAKKIESFKTNYVVTAAYIDSNRYSSTKGIYFLGYTKEALAFISWFDLPQNDDQFLFSQKTKKISLPLGFTTQLGQLEGISILPTTNEVCFSGEETNYRGFYAKQAVHCINNFTK